jgi:Protein of unknown function (DUF3137)
MAAVLEGHGRQAGDDRRLSELFERGIAPALGDLERRRLGLRARYLCIVAAMLGAVVLALLSLPVPHHGLAAAGIAFAIGYMLLRATERSYGRAVRRTVMPTVCAAIGEIEHDAGSAPELNLDLLQEIGLVPGHNRRRIDDVFRGRHRQTGFTMAEVRLRRERRSGKRSGHTVFQGLIFAIDVPRPVSGRVLIARDGGLIGNGIKGWLRSLGGMQRMALPDDAFEARFELYADRPEATREIVTPALCDSLVALAESHDGAPFQAAFADQRFFLAMPRRGDQFRIGSLFRSTGTLRDELAPLVHDVRIVHRLIDYLHGDRPPAPPRRGPAKLHGQAAPGPVERC